MKAVLVGKHRGFSTLEIMIALAVIAIVLAGVILADFGVQYWTVTAQTSNEALYKGKVQLEKIRSASVHDFYSAVSTPSTKDTDTACGSGGLCYYIQNTVADISPCSKYVESTISWQVPRYPTSTTYLPSYLSSAKEAVSLGGDCGLNYPFGAWSSPIEMSNGNLAAPPTGIDVVNGVAYVTESTSPYFEVTSVSAPGSTSALAPPRDPASFNALDVARDLATGRLYAYVAANNTQFRVIDVTNPKSPLQIASSVLSGVATSTSQGQGWRIVYYDRKVYLTTRYNSGLPELHIFDVGYPIRPFEVGYDTVAKRLGISLGTSVYDMAIRDQYSAVDKKIHRFLFLATTLTTGELKVLDVSDPKKVNPTPIATCDLRGNYQATAITVLGNTLYLGRDTPSGTPDLLAFDATDPLSPSFCTPLGQTEVETGFLDYSRHVVGIRASGPYLYIATTNTTRAHGQVQVRSVLPSSLSLLGTFAVPLLTDNALDFDGGANMLYIPSGTSSGKLQSITSSP